ncbi:MAG: RNA pseudouridine synthase, partial [Clostridia bacterium]|nr:RNA pseudouridine synthase [Clostridia bacterium]
QKMKDRELHKLYLCVVHGKPEKKTDTIEGYLVKDEKKNKVFVSKNQQNGGKLIRTKYTVLGYSDGLSLLEIDLLTGRTHQIRAHMASIGYPLLGDGKYGNNKQNRESGYKKQCLCSYKLIFDFTTDAEELSYLNGKEFTIDDVWFKNEFYEGTLKRGEKK